MSEISCVHCKKTFKDKDEIIMVDSSPVHEECQIEFVLNQHMNTPITLHELKDEYEEE